jgi:hypothetical protein
MGILANQQEMQHHISGRFTLDANTSRNQAVGRLRKIGDDERGGYNRIPPLHAAADVSCAIIASGSGCYASSPYFSQFMSWVLT